MSDQKKDEGPRFRWPGLKSLVEDRFTDFTWDYEPDFVQHGTVTGRIPRNPGHEGDDNQP